MDAESIVKIVTTHPGPKAGCGRIFPQIIEPPGKSAKARNCVTISAKDEDGNIIVDPRAERLTAMVMEAVKEKNKEHHDSFYPKRNCNSDDERNEEEIDREGKIELDDQIRADNCYMDIMKMNRDNKVFRKRLIKESRQSSS